MTASQPVYVLLGPKGAGKSTLGRVMESASGVRFLDVESVFLELPPERRGSYEGYAAVERLVTEAAGPCCLELTGASPHTPRLVESLRTLRSVLLVRVHAPLHLCIERVAARPGPHLPSSEDMVRRVYEIYESLDLDYDVEVDGTEEDLEETARAIVRVGSASKSGLL